MKKKVNVPGSDLDLKIKVSRPATLSQRQQLQEELRKTFKVTPGAKVDVVHGRSGDIDVLPTMAEYYPDDFIFDKLGVEPFKTNPVGRDAVRIIKDHCNRIGVKMAGKKIEQMVLLCQQNNKGISRTELIQIVKEKLGIF